ncbi:hypothetical protein [Actinoplanes subtropicus]|nr:hypothetical protein [Actinoplanes subtropicus]
MGLQQVTADHPGATYYASVVPQFIAETSATLKDLGFSGQQLRNDNFRGY